MLVLQEILRPKNWDELIGMENKPLGPKGPTEKEILIDLAKSDRALSIVMIGPPGTGKTSAIELFAREYLGEHYDTKYKKFNASSEITVKSIANDIIEFAGSEDDTDLRNVIFFDEVDGVKWQAQDVLRGILEDYSYNCIFLMACNREYRLHEAIISRSTIFRMKKVPTEWAVEWFKNVADLCHMKVGSNIPNKVLDYYNGDLRHIITDFFTKYYARDVYEWEASPSYAEEIINSTNPIETYRDLAQKNAIDPVNLLHELYDLTGKGVKTLSLACDRILNGGDILINMIMAIEELA